MAANFWTSTHSRQLVSNEQVFSSGVEDRAKGVTDIQLKQIKAYFIALIRELCQSCRLRQRVCATACTFFHRFFLAVPFSRSDDPYVVSAGCVYLAAKVEETVVPGKVVLHYLNKKYGALVYNPRQLQEMESYLIEALNFSLVIFSPYRPLQNYLEELRTSVGGMYFSQLATSSWSVLNDSYSSLLCLSHPPYMVAIGCIVYSAGINSQIDVTDWLSQQDADMDQVYHIAMELSSMYDHFRKPMSREECHRLLEVLHQEGDVAAI